MHIEGGEMSEELELKPCPACGSERIDGPFEYAKATGVHCQSCSMWGPECDTAENSIHEWQAMPRREDQIKGRCGECDFFKIDSTPGFKLSPYCTLWGENIKPDDYCSYWEPKS